MDFALFFSSLFSQIQSENSLDDQVRPENSLYWQPSPVCMRSGLPALHSCLSWIGQDLWWNRRPKLGPKTTSPRSKTAKKPVSQQHLDRTKGRRWTEVNPDTWMCNLIRLYISLAIVAVSFPTELSFLHIPRYWSFATVSKRARTPSWLSRLWVWDAPWSCATSGYYLLTLMPWLL